MTDQPSIPLPRAPASGCLEPYDTDRLQSIDELSARRQIVFGLNIVTYLACVGGRAGTGYRGLDLGDMILFVCFAFGTPWTVLGFWTP